jgi:hypothetical protein
MKKMEEKSIAILMKIKIYVSLLWSNFMIIGLLVFKIIDNCYEKHK